VDTDAVLHQTLMALEYVHAAGYAHCDVKPENLLLREEPSSPDKVWLRLCDYSSARPLCVGTQLLFEDPRVDVCTPYYRAPECALSVMMQREGGAAPYLGVGAKIDVWAAACVAAECVLGKPLFREDTNLPLLQAMVDELGPPTQPGWADAMPFLRKHRLAPPAPGTPAARLSAGELVTRARQAWTGDRPLWGRLRAGMSERAVDTLRLMLHWDPSGRHTARSARGQLGRDTADGPILKA
jgi:serine/threonine protein kinase